MKTYTLIGTPFSFYTAKARAYLLYKGLPYNEVLSTLREYKKRIIPQTGRAMVPVLVTPEGACLQDTAVIIDTIEKVVAERPVVPATPRQKLVSYLFELLSDEWLLLPAMHYRWNHHNTPFIYQEFGSVVVPTAPKWIRYVAGKWISKRFRGYLPMFGIDETTGAAIEAWYEQDFLVHLDRHFKTHPYLLGEAPSLGDVALMGPLYAHLYRDPAPGKIMRDLAPHVVAWVKRMQTRHEDNGKLLPDDQIPETLTPIIARQFAEQWPVLIETAKTVASHFDEGAQKIPRALGSCEFSIGDAKGKRTVFTFAQWKMQRVLDCYHNYGPDEKGVVDTWLRTVGGFEAMQYQVGKRLVFEKNRLKTA